MYTLAAYRRATVQRGLVSALCLLLVVLCVSQSSATLPTFRISKAGILCNEVFTLINLQKESLTWQAPSEDSETCAAHLRSFRHVVCLLFFGQIYTLPEVSSFSSFLLEMLNFPDKSEYWRLFLLPLAPPTLA